MIVKKFRGDLNDNELENLTPFLKELAKTEDVRPVDGRYARFKYEMERVTSSSISTRFFGDIFREFKLIDKLNSRYRHKPRAPKKIIDYSNFEFIDEGVAHLNLALRMSTRHSKKGLFFESIRAMSSKKVLKAETFECLEYDVREYEQKMYETEPQPAQEYESGPSQDDLLPYLTTNSEFQKFSETESPPVYIYSSNPVKKSLK